MIQQSHFWAYIQTKLEFKKIHALRCSQQHYLQQLRPGNKLKCQTLFFWAPKSLQMVTAAMKLKDAYSLEEKL